MGQRAATSTFKVLICDRLLFLLYFKYISVKIPDESEGSLSSGDLWNFDIQIAAFLKKIFQVVNFQTDMSYAPILVNRAVGNKNLKMDCLAPVVDHQQFGVNIENGFRKGLR